MLDKAIHSNRRVSLNPIIEFLEHYEGTKPEPKKEEKKNSTKKATKKSKK